jgi:hypothetical protein
MLILLTDRLWLGGWRLEGWKVGVALRRQGDLHLGHGRGEVKSLTCFIWYDGPKRHQAQESR